MVENDNIKQHLIALLLACTIVLLSVATLAHFLPQQTGLLLSKISNISKAYFIQLGNLPYLTYLKQKEEQLEQEKTSMASHGEVIKKNRKDDKKWQIEVADFDNENKALLLQRKLFSYDIQSEVRHTKIDRNSMTFKVITINYDNSKIAHSMANDIANKLDLQPRVIQLSALVQ